MSSLRLSDTALKSQLRHALLRFTACLAAIALLYFISRLSDMPGTLEGSWLHRVGRHGGWRLFLCAQIPLALFLLSTAYELQRACSRKVSGADGSISQLRLNPADRVNLAALFLIGAFIGLRSWLPEYIILCGAAYLAALTANALLMAMKYWHVAGVLEQTPGITARADHGLGWGVGLSAALIYSCLALWTVQAIGTAGDEPLYLVRAHGLLNRLGILSTTGVEPDIRSAFYWGNWSHDLIKSTTNSLIFVQVITPFYLLAGRLGAVILMALGGGAGLSGLFYLSRKLGHTPKTALLACGLVWSCPAYMVFSQHVYPELLGAALAIWGINILLSDAGRSWQRLAGLFIISAVLVLLKFRLGPLGISLILAGVLREFIWKWVRGTAGRLLSVIIALAIPVSALMLISHFYVWIHLTLSRLSPTIYYYFRRLPDLFSLPVLSTIPALLFDQEYGLIWYAPWVLLSMAAVPLLFRKNRGAYSLIILVCAITTLIVIYWRWVQWDAGYTPPGRFLTAQILLYAAILLPCLRFRENALFKCVLGLAAVWGAAYSLVICLNPMFRYHRRTGISHWLSFWNDAADTVVHRFFPSFISYYLIDMLPVLGILLILLVLGIWFYRMWSKGIPSINAASAGWGKFALYLTLAIVFLVGGITLAGRWAPTTSLMATVFKRQGASIHGALYPHIILVLLNKTGDRASTNIVSGPNTTKLVISAAHQVVGRRDPNNRFAPQMQVLVDGKSIGTLEIKATYPQKLYELPLDLAWGMHRLSMVYTKQPGRDQIKVERVMLR